MRSPGRIRTKSPTRTSAVGTSSSAPSRTTRAVRGARLTSRRIASEVRPRARASSQRPSTTRVMTTALTSKYVIAPCCGNACGQSVTATLKKYAALVPTETRVAIDALR